MSRAFILLLDSFGLGATARRRQVRRRRRKHLRPYRRMGRRRKASRCSCRISNASASAAAAHKACGEWAAGFDQRDGFTGAYGVAREHSTGKDTQSGHWEIAGLPVLFDWGYFPKTVPSFPQELTDKLQPVANVPGFLGNCHASGTDDHQRAGRRARRDRQADHLHVGRLGDADRRARRTLWPGAPVRACAKPRTNWSSRTTSAA